MKAKNDRTDRSRAPLRGAAWMLLLGGVASCPALAAETPEVVFSFGWKPGLKASVEYTASRTTGEVKQGAAFTYVMSAEAAPDQALAIRFRDVRASTIAGSGPQAAVLPAELAAVAFPNVLVSDSGDYRGLEDLAAQQAQFSALIDSLFVDKTQNPAARETLQRLKAMFASEAFLESKAREMWQTIVENWVDARLEIGKPYPFETQVEIPILPGLTVKMSGNFTAVATRPCQRGSLQQSCVELRTTSRVDPQDFSKVFEGLVARTLGDQAGVPKLEAGAIEIEDATMLLTEPAALIPHEYTTSRTVSGTITVNGQSQSMRRVENKRWLYKY